MKDKNPQNRIFILCFVRNQFLIKFISAKISDKIQPKTNSILFCPIFIIYFHPNQSFYSDKKSEHTKLILLSYKLAAWLIQQIQVYKVLESNLIFCFPLMISFYITRDFIRNLLQYQRHLQFPYYYVNNFIKAPYKHVKKYLYKIIQKQVHFHEKVVLK